MAASGKQGDATRKHAESFQSVPLVMKGRGLWVLHSIMLEFISGSKTVDSEVSVCAVAPSEGAGAITLARVPILISSRGDQQHFCLLALLQHCKVHR